MRLLHYTYRSLFLILFLLLSVWGGLFYYTIIEEVTDETDDSLENYRNILVNTALQDPSILQTEGNPMTMYRFRPISDEEAEDYKEKFYDATVYIEIEDEDEPVRVMKSCFMMPDGQFYELELMISTLEREDMIEAILIYMFSLYVLLFICMMVITRLVLKKAFRPLDHLLVWLRKVQPGKEIPVLESDTVQIEEFRELREAALDMSQRSYKAYQQQKQFIENASHELQTPLAIARTKIELLAESDKLAEAQMKEIGEIYDTLGRAVKLNKSLLLLSRIENKQYTETDTVVVNEMIDEILPDLMEIYEGKNIRLACDKQADLVLHANKSLIRILITNLLKNALIHTADRGEMRVQVTAHSLSVANTGDGPLDKERIFDRFYRSSYKGKESTGLGLSIARSVANLYGLKLEYSWDGMHCFTLRK